MPFIKITNPVIIDGVDYFGGEVVEVDTVTAIRIIGSGRAVEAEAEPVEAEAPKKRGAK